MIFSPEPANFSASDKPGVEFPRVWESPEKNKNLKLIKIAENGNRAKRKCQRAFLYESFKIWIWCQSTEN